MYNRARLPTLTASLQRRLTSVNIVHVTVRVNFKQLSPWQHRRRGGAVVPDRRKCFKIIRKWSSSLTYDLISVEGELDGGPVQVRVRRRHAQRPRQVGGGTAQGVQAPLHRHPLLVRTHCEPRALLALRRVALRTQ